MTIRKSSTREDQKPSRPLCIRFAVISGSSQLLEFLIVIDLIINFIYYYELLRRQLKAERISVFIFWLKEGFRGIHRKGQDMERNSFRLRR